MRGYLFYFCAIICFIFNGFQVNGQIKLNEVFANNLSIPYEKDQSVSDWVELLNTSSETVNLAGFALTDNQAVPGKWSFPAGASIGPNGLLVVLLDSGRAASTALADPLNAGFGLKSTGDRIFLFQNGLLMDAVSFGLQVGDLTIGRVPDGGEWTLTTPTANKANVAVTLGGNSELRVNEWMANPDSGMDDWFEIYNMGAAPVALSGLYLTDDATKKTQHAIAPLSFIGTGEQAYSVFTADGKTNNGPEHVIFSLKAGGESIGIYNNRGAQIDLVNFGAQPLGVSQGKLPDGTANFVSFTASPTPGSPNYAVFPGLVVNELLSHTDPPLEDAVEFYNLTAAPINIGGWYLSNKKADLKRYRIPDNTTVPANGYFVIYESQFNGPAAISRFTFNSAHGDEVYLSQAVSDQLTGYEVAQIFESAENGVSFGRYVTSVAGLDGVKFVAMSHRSFGVDDPATIQEFEQGKGAPNPLPKVGPVVISEVMYNPLRANVTIDNTLDEYIELQNITTSTVYLYDFPAHPENHWRLQNGLSYIFPANTSIPPLGTILVVSFDPVAAPTLASNFRSKYGVPQQVLLYGPYEGKLDNGGDALELYKPDPPQIPPHPDAGYVPYIRVDKVNYTDQSPWPTGADGTGKSLQKKNLGAFGNDPINWEAALPTAGRANSGLVTDTDADGMPDSWETANALNPNDPTDAGADPDLDNMTNLQEYIAGTDPHNKASSLKIQDIIPTLSTNTPLKLHFTAVADKSYTVEYRNSFAVSASWQKLTDVPAQTTTRTVEVTDTKTVGRTDRYYRLVTPSN